MLKKLCFYWRSFWRWSKWFLRWWSKKGLVGQRSERKPWVILLYIGDTDTTQLLYRDHKKAAFFSHPPFFGVKKHNSRFFFHNLTKFLPESLFLKDILPWIFRHASALSSIFPHGNFRAHPLNATLLSGNSWPLVFWHHKGSWWLISWAPRRLVQVGFHRADCLHQLILANLKLGHYSKAKAIGLERIWWLVVGGFWGLTLFFLGVLADIFFFQVKSCFCWALERGFLLVKKSSNKETGVIFFVFSFLKGRGDVPKCEVKDSGVKWKGGTLWDWYLPSVKIKQLAPWKKCFLLGACS